MKLARPSDPAWGSFECHLQMIIIFGNVGGMGAFNRREIRSQLMDVGYILFMIHVNCDNHATLASRPRLWIVGVPRPEATPETFEHVQSWACGI